MASPDAGQLVFDSHGEGWWRSVRLRSLWDAPRDMVRSGAPLDVNVGGDTLLCRLISSHAPLELIESVVAAGASTEYEGIGSNTALMEALQHGDEAMVRLLLRLGAQLRPPRCSVLFDISDAQAHLVDELVGLGAELDKAQVSMLETPLFRASVFARPAAVRALLGAGADTGPRNYAGTDALTAVGDSEEINVHDDPTVYDRHDAVRVMLAEAVAGGEVGRLQRVAGHRGRWAWQKRREVVVAMVEGWWC